MKYSDIKEICLGSFALVFFYENNKEMCNAKIQKYETVKSENQKAKAENWTKRKYTGPMQS